MSNFSLRDTQEQSSMVTSPGVEQHEHCLIASLQSTEVVNVSQAGLLGEEWEHVRLQELTWIHAHIP